METPLEQHQIEIERNKKLWESKPLIRLIYRRFYGEILQRIDHSISGRIVELGSGIGNLKAHLPEAISTDLFPNPWLDLVCDAYRLPFPEKSISNLILFDVFHHLERPLAFLRQAQRVLARDGRLILFEPYISAVSSLAYGLFHHEPIGWRTEIDMGDEAPQAARYYAAQGNATRLFLRERAWQLPEGWEITETTAMASFAYLLSGGLSKPALYPSSLLGLFHTLDAGLSRFPRIFGGRCLVVLKNRGAPSPRASN